MKCGSHGLRAVQSTHPDHLSHFSPVPWEANLDEPSIGSLAIGLLLGFGHLEIPAEEKGREESEVGHSFSEPPLELAASFLGSRSHQAAFFT